MNPIMSTSARQENQTVAGHLAVRREPMDVATMVKHWAPRIARSANSIGPKDRQWLYDIQRGRVSLALIQRLDELAGEAQLEDALFGPMEWRGGFVRRIRPMLPAWTDASHEEEAANHRGNLAQLAWHERRSSSTAQDLRFAMQMQAVMSFVLHDAVALEETRLIHVVSR